MLTNLTKITTSKRTRSSFLQSPATIAFGAVSLLVVVIVILVCPAATYAVIAIMGAAPAFLNALAAFIVALRPHTPATSKPQEQEQSTS